MTEMLTQRKTRAGTILLPYQAAWRNDQSDFKLWVKSRRIGATFAEANDAVMTRKAPRDCHRGAGKVDYWFSSADESAAYEFMEYCRYFDRITDRVADHFTEQVEDPETAKSATAFVLRFPPNGAASGARITAMSSSPRRFRSKGGDVTLDEFDYHDDPEAMWDAASPVITWGGRLRVMSTYNGQGRLFDRFVQMGKNRLKAEGCRLKEQQKQQKQQSPGGGGAYSSPHN